MLEKGKRMTRTRAVKSKKEFTIPVEENNLYTDPSGDVYVSWSTALNYLRGKIEKKEHIYFLNALDRGKIRSRLFFDNVFIPLESPMATLNCPIIISFKVLKSKKKTKKKEVKKVPNKSNPVQRTEEFIDVDF